MNDQNHMHEQPVEPEADETTGTGICAGSIINAALPTGPSTDCDEVFVEGADPTGSPIDYDAHQGWTWSTLGRRRMRKDELAAQPKPAEPLTEKLVRDDGHTQVYQRSDGLMSAYTYDGAKEGSDQPMLERDQAEHRFKAAMGVIAAQEKQLIEETCGITGVMRGASANANCQAEDAYYAKRANEKRDALERSFIKIFNEVLNSKRYTEAYEQAFLDGYADADEAVAARACYHEAVQQVARACYHEAVQQASMVAQEQTSGAGAIRGNTIVGLYPPPKTLPALPAHYHFDDVSGRATGRAQRLYISMETGEVLHTVWQAVLEDWPELADGAPWGTYSSALTPEQYKKVLASTKYKDTSLAQRALTKVQATRLAEQASNHPPGTLAQLVNRCGDV